jgi:hypothetical protein
MATVNEAMAIMGKHLVRWQCEKCTNNAVGWLAVGESTERPPCSSNYRLGMKQYPLRKKSPDGLLVPYVCGGKVAVILDERPAK